MNVFNFIAFIGFTSLSCWFTYWIQQRRIWRQRLEYMRETLREAFELIVIDRSGDVERDIFAPDGKTLRKDHQAARAIEIVTKTEQILEEVPGTSLSDILVVLWIDDFNVDEAKARLCTAHHLLLAMANELLNLDSSWEMWRASPLPFGWSKRADERFELLLINAWERCAAGDWSAAANDICNFLGITKRESDKLSKKQSEQFNRFFFQLTYEAIMIRYVIAKLANKYLREDHLSEDAEFLRQKRLESEWYWISVNLTDHDNHETYLIAFFNSMRTRRILELIHQLITYPDGNVR